MTYEEKERLAREAAIQRNLQGVDDRQRLGERGGESPIDMAVKIANARTPQTSSEPSPSGAYSQGGAMGGGSQRGGAMSVNPVEAWDSPYPDSFNATYTPPPQQQEEENPLGKAKQAYDMYQKFSGASAGAGAGAMGGGPAALASTGGAAGVSGGSMGPVAGLAASEAGMAGGGGAMAGGGSAAGGAAGGAGGGMGGAAAAAGPWAALAAVIAGNEIYAKKHGYRAEDSTQRNKDLVSGEVFHQDMEKRWLPKLGMKEGSKANKWGSHLANPVNPLSPGKTWKRFKDLW